MAHAFPKHVDDPPMFFLWPVDEAMPIILILGFGVVMKQLILCALVGLVVAKIYRKYKDSRPEGYLFHRLYFNGFMPVKTEKGMPDPFKREYVA